MQNFIVYPWREKNIISKINKLAILDAIGSLLIGKGKKGT